MRIPYDSSLFRVSWMSGRAVSNVSTADCLQIPQIALPSLYDVPPAVPRLEINLEQ
jgi:hypothetical protein